MTGLKDIVQGFDRILHDAAFKPTKDVFTFDAVPDSVIDKAFRIESRIDSTEYQLFMIREMNETLSVWIAYKIGRDAAAVRDKAILDREAIEKLILNDAAIAALDCDPIIELIGGEMESYSSEYLISRLDFMVNFVQSVTS